MDQREQFIHSLKRIKQNQFELPEGEKACNYLPFMLKYIGDPDPELRDYLIYKVFYQWILVKGYFCSEELRNILAVVTDQDHLFYQIGKEGDHSVFTRTFSVLVVALILAAHRKKPFLDHGVFTLTGDKLIQYYREEKDLRGDAGEEGWADGVSHGADAFDELVACPEVDRDTCQAILEEIKVKLYNGKYSFSEEEDERITSVVYRIIKNQLLPDEVIKKWIMELDRCGEWEYSRSHRRTRINVKNFIRSLYFRIIHDKVDLGLIDTLIRIDKKLNPYI